MTAGCSDPETKREIAVEELAALNEECDQEHTYSSYYHYYLFFLNSKLVSQGQTVEAGLGCNVLSRVFAILEFRHSGKYSIPDAISNTADEKMTN